ncbi:MAG: hypothetical protein DRH17_03320 [Deltaproteobacteria bacterium]|nr:MAG: hypothetical protein DRH17_03320 [Deltaproteobacteria bacterium]
MNPSYQPLAGVLTEKEVCEFLGITKQQLDTLRYNGLPFIKLNERRRLYFESDLMDLFKARRVTMNTAE